MQVAPLRHGLLEHSSSSTSQCSPDQPAGQVQEYANVASTQVALPWQGYDAHSSMSTLHSVPAQPFVHSHEKLSSPSTQLAPFSQPPAPAGQSSMFVHVLPPSDVSYPA
tara:strand:+ start:82 stop:408 length:327 start_codon:yes stop_codon:yes gene_type:complete